MKKLFAVSILALCHAQPTPARVLQTPPVARPDAQQPQPRPPARPAATNFGEYGVSVAVEPRLVVVMAALEAAGFDPSPGRQPSLFRARVRADQAGLDPELRERLRRFRELNKLKDANAGPAREAARYVSLAFALGPAPAFDAPARGDDLYEGVADVLDFAPLVREFYRRSGIEERLPSYVAEYRAEGDRARRAASGFVREVLNYLHTRPITSVLERVPVRPAAKGGKKKDAQPEFTTRERERRFVIVPDLLAVPGAINFRVIRDDYYVVAPPGSDLSSPEVRRAYLQYVIDPLMLRFNRDIALKRAEVRALLDERARVAPAAVLPDVFGSVARSLVAAADARMTAVARLEALAAEAGERARQTKDPERAALTRQVQERRAEIEDATAAELAEAYERGAVLAFYFAEQLRDQESAGFDFANFIPDMLTRVDPEREKRRPSEYAEARARAAGRASARREAARSGVVVDEREGARRSQLIRQLDEVSRMLRAGSYAEAEGRLRVLLDEHKGEPRVLFALGQTWSAGAADAANAETRDERLARALANYRLAISAADREADRALLSRAYVAAGRILAFLERNVEAAKMFDDAVALGDVAEGAYRDAAEERKKLRP